MILLYTGGGTEFLHVHQTNTLSTKLTAIVLSAAAIVVLYIIIRVIISYQRDKRLALEEKEQQRKFIDRILGKKKS